MTEKHVIIAGDDGNLYKLEEKDWKAHKMADNDPDRDRVNSLLKQGVTHAQLVPESDQVKKNVIAHVITNVITNVIATGKSSDSEH